MFSFYLFSDLDFVILHLVKLLFRGGWVAGEMENKAIFQLEVEVEVEVGAWQKLSNDIHTAADSYENFYIKSINVNLLIL